MAEKALSTASSKPSKKFKLSFHRVDLHFLFSDEEKKSMLECFNHATEFLTNVISTDFRCTQMWGDIVDSAYDKIIEGSSTLQIVQVLFSPPTTTQMMLERLIIEKIIVVVDHPSAAASESTSDPVRTKEYATTTRFGEKVLIAINPIVFNIDTTSNILFFILNRKDRVFFQNHFFISRVKHPGHQIPSDTDGKVRESHYILQKNIGNL